MNHNRKRNLFWIAGLAVLVILLLTLSMCTGRQAEEAPAVQAPTDATAGTTAETAAPPAPAAPATEPATEPTEATEETTAPTEAQTQTGTASGSSTPGGTGGGSTSSDDEDEDEEDSDEAEKETVDVPEPGTAENPYVEMLSDYPATVVSVKIPAGKSLDYLVFGSAGTVVTIEDPGASLTFGETQCKADESGIVTLDLSKTAADPVITIGNASQAEMAFTLHIIQAPGSRDNPLPIEDVSAIPVNLEAEDTDGCYYLFRAGVSGELILTTQTEGLEILVPRGEETLTLSESQEESLRFRLEEGEEFLLQAMAKAGEDGTLPALEGQITGQWLPDPGTRENPHTVTPEIPGQFQTLEIPAEGSLWYAITNGGGTVLTADQPGLRIVYNDRTLELPAVQPQEEASAETEETTGEPETAEEPETTGAADPAEEPAVLTLELAPTEDGLPVLLQLTNTGSEPAAYTLNLAYPVGSAKNPRPLDTLEGLEAELKEQDPDGYHFSWTAPLDGCLTVTADPAQCQVTLVDAANGTEVPGEEGTAAMDLNMGQTVLIRVMAVRQEDGTYPGIRAILEASFAAAPGTSRENPLVIEDPMRPTALSFSAGETVYLSGLFGEMTASVENAAGMTLLWEEDTLPPSRSGQLTLEFPGQTEQQDQPVFFAIASEQARDTVLTFAYPAGHEKNPAPLTLGENRAELAQADPDGFHFTWTALCDGFLTLTPEGENWQCALENITAGTEAVTAVGGEADGITMEVRQDEQLWILANTYDPGAPEQTPAGTVVLEAGFFDPLLGTEAKPIRLDTAEGVQNRLTVPASADVYYTAQAEGMVMTLSAGELILVWEGTEQSLTEGLSLTCNRTDSVFRLRNAGETEQSCTLVFAYPLGHRENPDSLELGGNTALLQADRTAGYSFAWTAECAGELTVAMEDGAQWQYVVENLTQRSSGPIHTSGEEEPQAAETVTVQARDQILVTVKTYDPEQPQQIPEGEVRFTASFVDPTLGREENPIWLEQEDQVTVPAGKTMYVTAKADGMVMTLTGSDVTVRHNGVDYRPEQGTVRLLCEGSSTFEPPVFAITNTGETDAVYWVRFEYPLGHFMNPMELVLGENTAQPETGTGAGIYFLWTAEEDGSLTVTMNQGSGWQYVVNHLTAGINGDIRSSSDVPSHPSQTLEVAAGDRIQVILHGSETQPEASVGFRAEFAAAEPETEPEETVPQTVPGEPEQAGTEE